MLVVFITSSFTAASAFSLKKFLKGDESLIFFHTLCIAILVHAEKHADIISADSKKSHYFWVICKSMPRGVVVRVRELLATWLINPAPPAACTWSPRIVLQLLRTSLCLLAQIKETGFNPNKNSAPQSIQVLSPRLLSTRVCTESEFQVCCNPKAPHLTLRLGLHETQTANCEVFTSEERQERNHRSLPWQKCASFITPIWDATTSSAPADSRK